MEAKTKNTKLNDDDLFTIVGAGYQIHTPVLKKPNIWYRLKGKPIASIIILVLIIGGCIFAEMIMNHDELYKALCKVPSGKEKSRDRIIIDLNEAPNSEFFFGTDSMGRDIFSLIWYGGRASIIIGLLSAAIITVIGIVYGCISGVSGSFLDSAMMRVTEVAGSIPSILLILLITGFFSSNNVLTLSLVIGITSWFNLARIVRSEVRQIRNQEYVLASRCMGARFGHIMLRHLIPNFVSAVMFVIISGISTSMTTESTLSFLGLGLPVEVVSWGSMLSLANRALLLNTWWVIMIPGLFLVITLLCITNIGHYFRKEVNRRPSNL